MIEYWRITVQQENGQCFSVCGQEDVLRTAQKEWLEYSRASEVERDQDDPILVIEGSDNSYDRAPLTVCVRKDAIVSMALVRMT